jgi:hypothetical protein
MPKNAWMSAVHACGRDHFPRVIGNRKRHGLAKSARSSQSTDNGLFRLRQAEALKMQHGFSSMRWSSKLAPRNRTKTESIGASDVFGFQDVIFSRTTKKEVSHEHHTRRCRSDREFA